MLYSNFLKRKIKIVSILIIIVLASFIFPIETYAESISPFSTVKSLSIGENSRHSITYENDNDYDIFVTPKIYKYYPQSEIVSELKDFEEFVKIDTDYIQIPKNSEKDINFQIIGPDSLDIGTYYNLIVFEKRGQTEEDSSAIGATGALSHIVQLNLVQDTQLERITDDYSVQLEVIDRGTPFIRPASIKLTFFNNSPYTLTPKGEIQVVKRSGDREPEYIKVNLERNRAYPKDTLEFEYEVENWYLEDILFGKTAFLKISNGIDDSTVNEEVKIPGFRNEFLYILATISVIVLLATSIRNDNTRPEPEYAE